MYENNITHYGREEKSILLKVAYTTYEITSYNFNIDYYNLNIYI